jgi:hypothetical protein
VVNQPQPATVEVPEPQGNINYRFGRWIKSRGPQKCGCIFGCEWNGCQYMYGPQLKVLYCCCRSATYVFSFMVSLINDGLVQDMRWSLMCTEGVSWDQMEFRTEMKSLSLTQENAVNLHTMVRVP